MTLLQRTLGVEMKADSGYITPIDRDIILSDVTSSLGLGGFLRLSQDYSATYEEIARRQLWARITINKLAYAIGRLPLKVYSGDDSASRTRVRDSSLAALISAPNETKETGTTPGFLADAAYDLLVYGNAIVLKAQKAPDQPVLAMRAYCPRYWSLDRDGNYVYQPDQRADKRTFKPWQVWHIVEPGPSTDGMGVSRLEAARLTLAIEYAAQRLGEAFFNNGARPGGIITVNGGLPHDQKQRAAAIDRFKHEIIARFGGVAKTGLPAVLEGNIQWQSMSHNLEDSAVVEHRQLTREEIAALYDVPQPAIGILDEANFASVDALHVMFYQDTLGWPVKLIEESFNAQVVRGVTAWRGQFAEFDLNAVMRGALKERLASYSTGINAGVYTSDEVRGWENLAPRADKQPEADLLRFPLNNSTALVPVGTTANGVTP